MKILLCLFLANSLSTFVLAQEVPLDATLSSLKFTGHAFLHDFNGEAREFTGSAKVDVQNPGLVTSAKLEIVAAKMTTFEPGRDKDMYAWLHIDTIP